MLNHSDHCQPSYIGNPNETRYKRDIFADMITAIELLKEFNTALNRLHPDVMYKVKSIM